MDRFGIAVLIFGSALQVFCWVYPADRLPLSIRAAVGIVSIVGIIYGLASITAPEVKAMGIASGRWLFVSVWLLVGAIASGFFADMLWKHSRSRAALAELDPPAAPAAQPSRARTELANELAKIQDHGYSIYNRWWTHCDKRWQEHFDESETWRRGVVDRFRKMAREDLVNEFNLPKPTDQAPATNVVKCPRPIKLIEQFHRVNRLGEIIRREFGGRAAADHPKSFATQVQEHKRAAFFPYETELERLLPLLRTEIEGNRYSQAPVDTYLTRVISHIAEHRREGDHLPLVSALQALAGAYSRVRAHYREPPDSRSRFMRPSHNTETENAIVIISTTLGEGTASAET